MCECTYVFVFVNEHNEQREVVEGEKHQRLGLSLWNCPWLHYQFAFALVFVFAASSLKSTEQQKLTAEEVAEVN